MKLLTMDDIAALFGVTRRTVRDHWRARPDFPPPTFAPTRARLLWDEGVVLKWAQRRVPNVTETVEQ